MAWVGSSLDLTNYNVKNTKYSLNITVSEDKLEYYYKIGLKYKIKKSSGSRYNKKT